MNPPSLISQKIFIIKTSTFPIQHLDPLFFQPEITLPEFLPADYKLGLNYSDSVRKNKLFYGSCQSGLRKQKSPGLRSF